MSPVRTCRRALALCLLLPACGSLRFDPPPVQPSSLATATKLVRARASQPFAPACLIVDIGETVEWRNLTPRLAVSVVSPRAPLELSSPALAAPYNAVAVESSDECVDGACTERLPFSYWRHTFTVAGVFDYKDGSGGTVTPTTYGYGMPTGPATAATAATGTVCVQGQSGDTCKQVCCTGATAGECAAGTTCIAGRCGGVKP